MAKHILSKSTFIKGDQCLKQLYLYKKRYFLRDRMPRERVEKFKRGTNIGIMAQDLFPGGVDVRPKSPSQYQKSVLKTSELIAKRTATIYEATVQYNEVLVMLDILHKDKDGWKGYEVKSSKFISETYIKDAALQYYVLKNSGIDLVDFSLIIIDENYIHNGELELNKFFTSTSVIDKCIEYEDYIEKKIEEEKNVLTLMHSPDIKVGKHCFYPYDCDFIGHCWKKSPKDSVFDLVNTSLEEKQNLFDKNISSITDIPESFNPSPIQNAQIESLKNNKEFVQKKNIQDILKSNRDFILLDMLFYSHAIPFFINTNPYQTVPIVISTLDKDQNFEIQILEKKPFLSTKKILTNYLSKNLQIILFERKPLEWIFGENWNNELPDNQFIFMEDVFVLGHYFHPSFKKSVGIKTIAKSILEKPALKDSTITSDELALYAIYDLIHKKGDRNEITKNIKTYVKWKLENLYDFYQYF